MKLRIHDGSIRLRLGQSEVRALVEGREVAASCPTLPLPFVYSLRPEPGIASMTAVCDGGRLTVLVPATWLAGWETDSRVGFVSEDGEVEVRVEKDWKCTNPASPADNADCFENPVACE